MFWKLYINRFNNLDDIEKFLRKRNLLKIAQKEIKNLSSPISIKEMEFVIKNLPIKKNSAYKTSLVNAIKHFRKKYY